MARRSRRFALFIVTATLVAQTVSAAPTFAPLFTDHAVLQRDKPLIVSGRADPGEQVTVTLAEQTSTTAANRSGNWEVPFQAMPAGGPYRLTAKTATGMAEAQDVMLGDIWLCSGQSNMELQITRALNSNSEIASADDPLLRIVTIPKGAAMQPAMATTQPLTWASASPQSVPDFSAACYFMARQLRATQKVPIGAINASWGGTQIRAWLDPAGTRSIYGQGEADQLALYVRDPLAADLAFGKRWTAWWRGASGDAAGAEPWSRPDALSWKPVPQISHWDKWTGAGLNPHIGWVWLRRTVRLTREEAAQGAVLSLGVIDDMDETFVNGVAIGNSFGWDVERNYKLPARYWREGDNEIVVAAGNTWGTGGFGTGAEKLVLTLGGGKRISLGEAWRYAVSPVKTFAPRAPWDRIAGLGLIHNGMIAPLGPYTLKGIAWYQGESDADITGYDKRLAALFAGWRAQFRDPALPFLVVSLANYGLPPVAPVASGWAALREEQRRTVAADGHAALIIAVDIGEPTDIHPANKQVLGDRLARAARAIGYGETLAANGPEVAAVSTSGGDYLVEVKGARGALVTWSAAAALGFELCGETQASCRFARAVPQGDRIIVAGDGKPATRIRYAWADSPVVNLFDSDGMPLGPFEMAIISKR